MTAPNERMAAGIPLRGRAGALLVAATVLASMVGFIDAYMINVAVPAIGRDLGTGVSGLQWVLTGYLVTVASLLLLAGAPLVAAGGRAVAPGDGPQTRFLSLLYGELAPLPGGGVRCTLAAAGHPLPLLLGPDGTVRTVAHPQTILGVVEDLTYTDETFDLCPGDSLLCVTDGVTERRDGSRQFDDADGLTSALAGCAGLSAAGIADRIRRLVHDFAPHPPEDDLALLTLQVDRIPPVD